MILVICLLLYEIRRSTDVGCTNNSGWIEENSFQMAYNFLDYLIIVEGIKKDFRIVGIEENVGSVLCMLASI